MATLNLWTYQDCLDHVIDWWGANVGADAQRDAKRAIQEAVREFASAARWSYYYSRGRVNTNASQVTGTIAYDSASRQLTLTGATWPTWAPYGNVVLSNIVYKVASYVSSTILTLSVNSNPGADVAAGTTYTLYRDTYPLPIDFVSADAFLNASNYQTPWYVHPREWLSTQRIIHSPATPRYYTFMGDPNFTGAMAVRFSPPPDQAYAYDYIYQRRPRALTIPNYATGKVTIGTGTASVSGAGSAWTSNHAGCVLRIASDGVTAPTGLVGSNPYAVERIVTAVSSGTALTVDNSVSSTFTSCLYYLSDPLDVEPGTMLNTFLRCLEWQAALTRKQKDRVTDAQKAWRDSLIQAREADSRTFAPRSPGMDTSYRPRLAYMPAGPDIS